MIQETLSLNHKILFLETGHLLYQTERTEAVHDGQLLRVVITTIVNVLMLNSRHKDAGQILHMAVIMPPKYLTTWKRKILQLPITGEDIPS